MSTNDQLREDLQKLVARFAKAGWVDGSMITSDPCKVDFTPLGTQRMTEMVGHINDIEASGLEPTGVSIGDLGEIIHELLPPNFSESEFKTLLVLLQMYGQRNG